MPAPPPESLPAIVRAVGISLESTVMIADVSSGSLAHSFVQTATRVRRAAAVASGADYRSRRPVYDALPFTAVPFVLTPFAVMLLAPHSDRDSAR